MVGKVPMNKKTEKQRLILFIHIPIKHAFLKPFEVQQKIFMMSTNFGKTEPIRENWDNKLFLYPKMKSNRNKSHSCFFALRPNFTPNLITLKNQFGLSTV